MENLERKFKNSNELLHEEFKLELDAALDQY